MSRVRSVPDWFRVRDPGWGRLRMARRTLVSLIAGMAAGYAGALALGQPILLGLIVDTLLGELSGMAVPDASIGELARDIAWYVPPFAVALLVAILLRSHVAVGFSLLVVVMFLQVYLARFGHIGQRFGTVLFAFYIVGLTTPFSLQEIRVSR